MIPQETKDAILKLFSENLHVRSCSTNHQSVRFEIWPHSEGHASGTCENCGLVIIRPLPDWVEPAPRNDPFKTADFGPANKKPDPEPEPVVEVKKKAKKETADATDALH